MSEKRFVGYYRVSTDKQGRSGLGLEAQKDAVERHVRAAGGTVLRDYIEVESGKRNDRPKIAQAIAHAKVTGSTLIIAKLDRLARSVAFISTLMESGVDFVAADMPLANRLTIHILAAVAEHEREAISQRTKDALQAAKRRGVRLGNPNGARALHGLGNAAAIAATKAHARRRAEDLLPIVEAIRAEGWTTLADIAREMNQRGIKTARDAAWHPASVMRLLRKASAA